jgi:hypothetical protein
LLVLVAALLAVILLWERRAPATGERDAGKLKVFEPAVAKTGDIDRRGEAPLHLKKGEQDRWSLVAPVADMADRYAVEGFLERLVQARALRFPATGTPADEMGLDKPRATWTFKGEGGAVCLEVGRKAPFDEGLYLRVNGRLSLVPGDMESLLLRPADEFRLRNLTAAATQEIRSFTVEEAGKRRLCARRDASGGWEVTAPFADWGASDKIEQMLDDVSLCLVDTFEAAGFDRRSAGLDPPLRKVRLEMEKGPAVEIALGGSVPGGDPTKNLICASVSGRPSAVTVSANSIKSLTQDPEEFRSLKLFRHDALEATELTVRGGRTLSLKRSREGAWLAQGADSAKPAADLGGLPAALPGLRGQKALPWQGPTTPGFAPTEWTFTLKGDGFEEKVDVGVEHDGKRLAHAQGRSVALLVPREDWMKLDDALKLATGATSPPVPGSQSRIP